MTAPTAARAALTAPPGAMTAPLVRVPGWRWVATEPRGTFADATLVVPTYGRPDDVVGLLDCLRELPDLPGEVVLVDGSLDEATRVAVRGWVGRTSVPFDLLLVRSPAGLTRQRNVGIDVSGGRFVFFLDDDCRPEPGYFRALRQLLVDDVDGRVGAATAAIVNEMGRPLDLRWRLRLLLGIVPRGESGEFLPSATSLPSTLVAPFTGSRPIEVLSGGASCFRREVFALHRFSGFFSGYSQGEDLEMARRVARQWQLRWCGDAHVVHHHAPGSRPPSWQKGMMEIRNRHFIWRRHVPRPAPLDVLRFWADIAFILGVDLARFVVRPVQWWHLPHAAGVALGAVRALVAPSRYAEPPAAREYELELLSTA